MSFKSIRLIDNRNRWFLDQGFDETHRDNGFLLDANQNHLYAIFNFREFCMQPGAKDFDPRVISTVSLNSDDSDFLVSPNLLISKNLNYFLPWQTWADTKKNLNLRSSPEKLFTKRIDEFSEKYNGDRIIGNANVSAGFARIKHVKVEKFETKNGREFTMVVRLFSERMGNLYQISGDALKNFGRPISTGFCYNVILDVYRTQNKPKQIHEILYCTSTKETPAKAYDNYFTLIGKNNEHISP